jgi:hypothetical protein
MACVHTVIELFRLPSRLTFASRLLRTVLGSSPSGKDQCSYHNCGSACSIDSPAGMAMLSVLAGSRRSSSHTSSPTSPFRWVRLAASGDAGRWVDRPGEIPVLICG